MNLMYSGDVHKTCNQCRWEISSALIQNELLAELRQLGKTSAFFYTATGASMHSHMTDHLPVFVSTSHVILRE